MTQNRHLAVIMFTDIVGYTAMMSEDEEHAYQILKQNQAYHRKNAETYNGKMLKEIGDGNLLTFNSITNAIKFGIQLINDISQNGDYSLRIGIHSGEVIIDGDEIYGDGVNIASRIEGLAGKNEILISAQVYDSIKSNSEIETISKGKQKLKNVKEPVKVYSVLHSDLEKQRFLDRFDKSTSKKLTITILIILTAGIAIWFYSEKLNVSQSSRPSVAVLPFKIIGEDQEGQYFADGVQEEILNQLFKIGGIDVKSRSAVEQFRNTSPTQDELVNGLNLTHYLEGSARTSPNGKVRITVQLIDASNNNHVWVQNYDRDFTQIFEVHSEIARQIASELKVNIDPEIALEMNRKPTSNPEAWDSFLKARYHIAQYTQFRDPNDLKRAVQYLHSAINEDEKFALAYAKLAEIYLPGTFYNSLSEFDFLEPDSSIILAGIALQIDSTLGTAYWPLASQLWTEMKLDSVESIMELAIKKDPRNPDVYLNYATFLYIGKQDFAGAIRMNYEALMLQKDPMDIAYRLDNIGWYYFMAGDYEKALDFTTESIDYLKRRNIQIPPQFNPFEIYMVMGDFEKMYDLIQESRGEKSKLWSLSRYHFAKKEFEESAIYFNQLFSDYMEELYFMDLVRQIDFGYSLIKIGDIQRGREYCFKGLEALNLHPERFFDHARAHASLNNIDSTYFYLERWIESEQVTSLNADYLDKDPVFEFLWKEESFKEIHTSAKMLLTLKLDAIWNLEKNGIIPKYLEDYNLD